MKRYKVTQIMNTKQLGLMLVAGLLSFGASAQVDLNVPPTAKAATVMLANENEIDSKDGTDVSGEAYNVTGEAGFIIPTGETYYARIDLGGGAEFGATVVDKFTLSGTTDARASGGMNTGSVIISLNADSTVAVDAAWELDGMTYTLNGRATVSFTYRLFESATDAISGGDNALSTQSANLVMFSDATSMAGAASASPQIDVATSSVKYETGSSTTHIMKINIKNTAGNQLEAIPGGMDLVLNDVVNTITLTATGNFTAVAAAVEDGPAGKVWLDADDTCTPSHAAVVDDDTTPDVDETFAGRSDNLGLAEINEAGLEAVVTLTNAENDNDDQGDPTGVFGAIADAYLCMQTNGVSVIPEITYSGVLSMTAEGDYEAIDDVLFTGSKIEKNSEIEVLNFLLTPNGVFRNMVRLTNTSNVQGSNLMVTLINDAGDQVSFSLSDAGVSDELAPRASTPLININALYEAAQAVDRGMDADDMPIAAFTVTGGEYGNKLRAKFEGSVLEDSLEAQALSVSTDNTTFFTF
jgi:hypothetical protein